MRFRFVENKRLFVMFPFFIWHTGRLNTGDNELKPKLYNTLTSDFFVVVVDKSSEHNTENITDKKVI